MLWIVLHDSIPQHVLILTCAYFYQIFGFVSLEIYSVCLGWLLPWQCEHGDGVLTSTHNENRITNHIAYVCLKNKTSKYLKTLKYLKTSKELRKGTCGDNHFVESGLHHGCDLIV